MRTLRGRLFVSLLAVTLLCVGVALAIGIVLTRQALEDSIKEGVARQATQLATQFAQLPTSTPLPERQGDRPPPGNRPDRSGDLPFGGRPPGGQPRGGPPPGRPAGGRGEERPQIVRYSQASSVLPAAAAAAAKQGKPTDGVTSRQGRKQIYSARPISGRGAFVLVSRPADITSGDYDQYLTGLLVAAAIAAALAALMAALLSRTLDRPLTRVVNATKVLASGRSPDPVPPERTAELAALVDSFNAMASQLSRAREAERAVLLSTSHELRTPLTAISGYAEGIEDGTMEPSAAAAVIARESDRLERLVADLLALARLDQGVLDIKRERVDLEAVATEAKQRLAGQASERGVDISVQAQADSTAAADHGRTLQIVSNLVENGVRLTPVGGDVTVHVAPGSIVVADTGPGIAEQDLPATFERFHLRRRAGAASGEGSGIGLAIVRELTEAMGGSVEVENAPGGGTRFTVSLPH